MAKRDRMSKRAIACRQACKGVPTKELRLGLLADALGAPTQEARPVPEDNGAVTLASDRGLTIRVNVEMWRNYVQAVYGQEMSGEETKRRLESSRTGREKPSLEEVSVLADAALALLTAPDACGLRRVTTRPGILIRNQALRPLRLELRQLSNGRSLSLGHPISAFPSG